MNGALAIGLDFGTGAARALLADATDGSEIASAAFAYPSGSEGVLLGDDPNLARQNPADYILAVENLLPRVLKGADPRRVVGIGVDTTGSSPMPLDAEGTPLAMTDRFRTNPDAHVWLWKDHTSHEEAAEITALARNRGEPYLARCGGTYSSEWFWSKILRCARVAPEVFAAAASWAEIADWIPAWMAGETRPDRIVRSVCAAGHKAMFADEWGGLPSEAFLAALDPRIADLRSRLYHAAFPSDRRAGGLSRRLARLTGLREGLPIAVGAFDAHFGAVAAGVAPGVLVKIIGTSTCDCTVRPVELPFAEIPGVSGIVRGSILPGQWGIEAGQSAVGDIFGWVSRLTGISHAELSEGAARLRPGESGLVALDWNNGNRTILVDPLLTGLVVGQTLATTPAELYRAEIEATAFGALRIIERLEESGVPVKSVVACGGIPEKSPLAMGIYASVLNRRVSLSRAKETCALGGAIFGAVVGGAHPDAATAQRAMAGLKAEAYDPDPAAVAVYRRLGAEYRLLHDAFGRVVREVDLSATMKRLIALREEVRGH